MKQQLNASASIWRVVEGLGLVIVQAKSQQAPLPDAALAKLIEAQRAIFAAQRIMEEGK